MGKSDWILIVGILCITGVIYLTFLNSKVESPERVLIKVEQETYGIYDLSQDQIININDTNILEIRDGAARMTKADCPDKLCMKQKEISKNRASIICLPNRIVVTIENADEDEVDAISN